MNNEMQATSLFNSKYFKIPVFKSKNSKVKKEA